MRVHSSQRHGDRFASLTFALVFTGSMFGATNAFAGDEPVPPPPPGFEPAPAQTAPAPPPSTPPPGAQPPPPGYPPGYAPPGYAPPGYAPPGYPQPGYGYPPGYPPPAYGYPPPGYGPNGYGYGAPPPAILPYTEGDPIPTGYKIDTHPRRGLVVAGLSMSISAYGLSLLTAFFADSFASAFGNNRSIAWPLYIPAIGPFIGIGVFDSEGPGTFILALDGLVQTGGLALIIAGVAAPEKRLVRDPSAQARNGFMTVVPMPLGKNGYGLGLVGTM